MMHNSKKIEKYMFLSSKIGLKDIDHLVPNLNYILRYGI